LLTVRVSDFGEATVGDLVLVAIDDPNSGLIVRMLPRGSPFSYSTKQIR
jgi:hypothetical protein